VIKNVIEKMKLNKMLIRLFIFNGLSYETMLVCSNKLQTTEIVGTIQGSNCNWNCRTSMEKIFTPTLSQNTILEHSSM
jgi:hypothetical protein